MFTIIFINTKPKFSRHQGWGGFMTPECLEIIHSLGFALNSAIHKLHKIKLEILGITNSNKQDH